MSIIRSFNTTTKTQKSKNLQLINNGVNYPHLSPIHPTFEPIWGREWGWPDIELQRMSKTKSWKLNFFFFENPIEFMLKKLKQARIDPKVKIATFELMEYQTHFSIVEELLLRGLKNTITRKIGKTWFSMELNWDIPTFLMVQLIWNWDLGFEDIGDRKKRMKERSCIKSEVC